MTTQTEVYVKREIDESKIWRGEPSTIRKEAKEGFIEWLLRIDEEGKYVNKLVLERDIGLSFEWYYQQTKDIEAPMPAINQSSMSVEAKNWGGLDRFDPCIAKVRFRHGVLAGGLHTWATMPIMTRDSRGKLVASREAIVSFIEAMPEA